MAIPTNCDKGSIWQVIKSLGIARTCCLYRLEKWNAGYLMLSWLLIIHPRRGKRKRSAGRIAWLLLQHLELCRASCSSLRIISHVVAAAVTEEHVTSPGKMKDR